MKAIAFVIVMMLALSAQSQSLKEALYGGKLKADTGAVIRKGDSAKIQENMARKAAEKLTEDSINKAAADSVDQEALAAKKEKALAAGEDTTAITLTAADTATVTAVPTPEAVRGDNNAVWKAYIDTLTATIRSEVIPSSKVKKGSYFVLVEYDIKTDGEVFIKNVSVDPESSFLQQQVKDRLTLDAPRLNPIVDANGRARNVARKQVLNFEK